MLKSLVFANALTAVSLIVYVICRVLAQVAPDFLFRIAQSWFHTFSMSTSQVQAGTDLGSFIFGAAVLAILAWVSGYTFAELYNRWTKK